MRVVYGGLVRFQKDDDVSIRHLSQIPRTYLITRGHQKETSKTCLRQHALPMSTLKDFASYGKTCKTV